MTDAELIDAIRAGDEAALPTLLARHAPSVLRFARKMCRNDADADDVLQETLLSAARGVRDLGGGAAVSTWLYTVARNHCLKKRRRGKHEPASTELDESLASSASPERDTADQEIRAALERAIATLDDASREVLVLRDVEGLSAAETAEVIGASVDAVKSRLHRARATVRTALAPVLAPGSVPSDPACPDVVDMLSRHLEGEIGSDACAAMEAHVATCGSCSRACSSLREAVALCHASNAAPSPEAARHIRAAIARALA